MGENVIELTIKLFFFLNSWTYKTSSKNLQAGVNSKKKKPHLFNIKYLHLRRSPFISIFIRRLDCGWSKNILLLLICDLVMFTCFFDITEEEGRCVGSLSDAL